MRNITTSCDISRTIGRSDVNVNQYRCLLTDVCVTNAYRYDAKNTMRAFGTIQDLRQAILNPNIRKHIKLSGKGLVDKRRIK